MVMTEYNKSFYCNFYFWVLAVSFSLQNGSKFIDVTIIVPPTVATSAAAAAATASTTTCTTTKSTTTTTTSTTTTILILNYRCFKRFFADSEATGKVYLFS